MQKTVARFFVPWNARVIPVCAEFVAIGGVQVPGPFLTLPPHVRNRIVSWRLAPQTHPYAQDGARSLWQLMSQSLAECPGYQWPERLLMRLWATGVLFAPRSLARSLACRTRTSGLWRRVLGLIRPQSRALWTAGPDQIW